MINNNIFNLENMATEIYNYFDCIYKIYGEPFGGKGLKGFIQTHIYFWVDSSICRVHYLVENTILNKNIVMENYYPIKSFIKEII